ncbi:MAG: O-antigen ligase family protein [Candidatus Komeilibacteria bacterium]|nr:O-antigen ligase family protein [Candidatus Komeilibacteria bacterium]
MIYGFLNIIYLLLFTVIAQKNLKWGLYLIVALLPTYLIRFTALGVPMTLLESMILILFIVWLLKEKISLNPLVWLKNIKTGKLNNKTNNAVPKILRLPIILLLIASTISVFISPDFNSAAGIWKAYFIEPLMLLLVIVYNIKTTDEIKNIIRALGVTAIAIGIFTIIQKLTGALIFNPFWATEETRRVTTFFGYPNANALFLLPIVFLNLNNLLTEKKKLLKLFNLAVIVLSILTIFWTGSTGALIGLAAGLLALLIIHKKTRLLTLLAGATVILILSLTPIVQNKISKSLFLASQTKLPLVPTDLAIRTQQWRETTAMLADRPLTGAGLAGYQALVAPYHVNRHIEIYLYPHNFFLNFWTETGLLGLIAIIWLLFAFLKLVAKQPSLLTFTAISAMIALLVYGLVDVPYFKNDLAVEFWLIIGIVIALLNESRRRARVV